MAKIVLANANITKSCSYYFIALIETIIMAVLHLPSYSYLLDVHNHFVVDLNFTTIIATTFAEVILHPISLFHHHTLLLTKSMVAVKDHAISVDVASYYFYDFNESGYRPFCCTNFIC